jgi:hypothetical protein
LKIRRNLLICFILSLCGSLVFGSFLYTKAASEAPKMEWEKLFSGNHGYSVVQTNDGGFALTGVNGSSSLLIKTDFSGNSSWVATVQLGEKSTNLPWLVETEDGGYAVGGTWYNNFALVRFDSNGNVLWNRTYHYDAPLNYLRALVQTSDGGFAIVGTYMTDVHGEGQIWFIKTDASGDIMWNRTIVGPLGNFVTSLLLDSKGGYSLVVTNWAEGPYPSSIKIFKTDSEANVQWNSTYGGEDAFYSTESESGIFTDDGGYLIGGTGGPEGDLWRAWLVKTDSNGKMIWNGTYGGIGSMADSVIQTMDGGYAFAGLLNGKGGWVVKTDALGGVAWNLTFTDSSFVGSSTEDYGKCIIQTNDGGYTLVGTKEGMIWLAKTSASESNPVAISFDFETLALAAVIIVVLALIAFSLIRKRRNQEKLLKHARLIE